MTLILFLYAIGATFGHVTSILARGRTHQRDFLNVCVGIIGALFGGLFLAPRVGGTAVPAGFPSGGALLLAAVSAAALLALLSLLRLWIERRT